jgi:hypothetical protein
LGLDHLRGIEFCFTQGDVARAIADQAALLDSEMVTEIITDKPAMKDGSTVSVLVKNDLRSVIRIEPRWD